MVGLATFTSDGKTQAEKARKTRGGQYSTMWVIVGNTKKKCYELEKLYSNTFLYT